MKLIPVVMIGLILCSALFAADYGLTWKNDWGFVDNFHDEFNLAIEELELGLYIDIGEYNYFTAALGSRSAGSLDMDAEWNTVKFTSDLGGYIGSTCAGLIVDNGYGDFGGGGEYSDFGLVGYAGIGTELADLKKGWGTCLTFSSGLWWASLASSWNIGVNSFEESIVNADSERQVQAFAGAVDLVSGLSFETGIRVNPDRCESTFVFDAAYVVQGKNTLAILGGSLAHTTLEGSDFFDIYGLDFPVYETIFGLGVEFRKKIEEKTEFYTSVSYTGDEVESLRAIGGGFGIIRGIIGAEAATSYHLTLAAGKPAFEGLDLSVFSDFGSAQITIGYVFTDGYGWSNNSTALMTAVGGVYVNFTSEF